MARSQALPPGLPPRGLSREAAAQYLGIGATLFDRQVAAGTLPAPVWIGGRKVWDRRGLDRLFGDSVPGAQAADVNEWDAVL
jgi:hypothetical protein